jgi:putative thioredoxin
MNTAADPIAAVFDVGASTFQRDVLERSRETAVLVDFWATWCAPCKALTPVLERIVQAFGGAVVLAKVDVDREPALAQHFQIRSVPTVMLVRDGRIVGGFPGALPESEVRRFLAEHGVEPGGTETPDEAAPQPVDPAAEVARLRAAVDAEPEVAEQRLELALALLEMSEALSPDESQAERSSARSEASALLDELPANLGADRRVAAARARIRFAEVAEQSPPIAELERALAADENDHAARHRLGVALVMAGDVERGLETLLDLLRCDRGFQDGLPRQALLDAFQVVGDDDRVRSFRRRMTALLY